MIIVPPSARLVARPELLTVATDGYDEVQLARLLTFKVLESLYVAVAVNCWLVPSRIDGIVGETVSATTMGVPTVRLAVPLIPSYVALMIVNP